MIKRIASVACLMKTSAATDSLEAFWNSEESASRMPLTTEPDECFVSYSSSASRDGTDIVIVPEPALCIVPDSEPSYSGDARDDEISDQNSDGCVSDVTKGVGSFDESEDHVTAQDYFAHS